MLHSKIIYVLVLFCCVAANAEEPKLTPAQQAEVDLFCKAAQRGDVKTMKAMLAEEPLLRFRMNSEGFSPLHVAAMAGKIDAVKELIIRMGDPDKEQATFLGGPLQYAAHRGHFEVCEYLLESGADVHARDANERTPLIWAVMGKRVEVATLLLNHKADIQATNLGGWSPLHYAYKTGDKKMISMLEIRGADRNAINANGIKAVDVPVAQRP